ncbi:transposon Ty3-I Gag-Pol polyprotein [Trichonephila clavipes]|nr:transposon Ty3-I Gag-Pol polyprotein [Trichonephila clavipes]
MCAVSKKLVNDMLISATTYEILLENVQLFGFENQRDFECTKDKDIQLEREEELSALVLGQETDTHIENKCGEITSFVKLQRMDKSLRSVWGQAENKQNEYDIGDGVLVHTESICGENVIQVVLPTYKSEEVMRVAHEIPLARHLGERRFGDSSRFATPGHPESMGAVERWNRTLKEMLNKNIQENGNNWDSHLPYLMFAYREVSHSTTGVSPYQLVYGRLPNGPLKLLKEAHNLARGNSDKAQAEYASRYNLRSSEKRLAVGDQVLVLIPSSSHKLLKKWMGSASIIELPRPHTERVKMEDGSERERHFNKLRPYVARIEQIDLISDQDNEFGDLHYAPTDTVELDDNDIYEHVMDGSAGLENSQKHQFADLLFKCSDVFSSVPGSAKVKGHSVSLMTDFVPKKLNPYRIPIALQEEVNKHN